MFLSLLNQLNMTNPVVIGRISDLKKKEMFILMKNVMSLDQTISLTTAIKNTSRRSSRKIRQATMK